MKITVDGVDLFTLTETQKKVLQYEMHKDSFNQEIKSMLRHIVEHKYKRCYDRMKKVWEPKLIQEGATEIPSSPDKFAEHVFKHSDYKNRSSRDLEVEKSRLKVRTAKP